MRFRTGLVLLAVSLLPVLPNSLSNAQSAPPAAGLSADNTRRSAYSAARQIPQGQRDQMRIQAAMARMRAHPSTSPHTSSGGAIIETIAGSAPFQSPITAPKAGLGQTQGVVEDANGNLYVSTGDLRTVLKIDSSGNVTVYAGVPLPAGPAVASGDGGPATAATLVSPMGLALDASGNLYIADSGSYTVREVAASNGIISTVAGMAGSFGHTGDGGPATSATLQRVQSLVLDGNGNLFISDTNGYYGYIRELNLSSGMISTFAGANPDTSPSPVLCSLIFTASCSATSTAFPFGLGPSDLAYYGGTLYATLEGSPEGLSYPAVVSILVGTGNAQVILGGTTYNPQIGAGVANDAAGNLDITGSGTISQLKAGGTTLTTIAGNGQFGYAGDGGPATSATLLNPVGLSITPSGGILFGDYDHVRLVNPAGIISTVAGNGEANLFGDSGPGGASGMDLPLAIAVDGKGNVFIDDFEDNVVRELSSATGVISTVAGNGSVSTGPIPTGSSSPGDGGPATQTAINSIFGLAVDNSSNLYIGVLNEGIRVVNTTTGIVSTLNTDYGGVSCGMAFDGVKTLYAGDGESVAAINVTDGTFTFVVGNPSATPSPGNGDGGLAVNTHVFCQGLAVNGNGNLYIADSRNDSVRVVNLSTGIIETFAGSANNYTYSGDGGLASAAGFYSVDGVSYDGYGHLQIVDNEASVIRQVDLATNIITTIAGTATPGFTGDGSLAGSAELDGPDAIAADAAGNLYIADALNDRIRRVVQNPTPLRGTVSAPASYVPAGSSTELTATLSGGVFGIAPTGSVTFLDGTTPLGTATLSASSTAGSYLATLTDTALAAGTHSITAQFAGDSNYAASVTSALTITAAGIPATLKASLSASPTSFLAGTSVTLSTTVSGAFTGIAPTGSITFLDGTTSIGTSTLTASSTTGSYVATLTNNTLAAGTHSITAQYPGDANYAPVTTAAVVLTVTAPIPPSYTVAASPSSLSIAQGSAGTTVLTVTPAGGFNQAVSFSCGSGLPTGVSCSFSPASVTPTGTAAVSTTLTIQTTGTSTAMLKPQIPETRWWLPTGATSLACLLMLGVPRIRRRGIWLALLFAILAAGANGCGSGGSTGGGGGNTNPNATPLGTYSIKLAATSGSGSSATTEPGTLSLTVTE